MLPRVKETNSALRVFNVGCLYDGNSTFVSDCSVFIRNEVICGIFQRNDNNPSSIAIRRDFADAEIISLPDSFILPGLINSHHHCYSALARGIPIRGAMPDFPTILSELWWKLDSALDREAVEVSTLVTAIDSIRHGCTTIVDHHSSPAFIRGSLGAMRGILGKLRLTSVLCYETTDRNGPRALTDAVEENLDFAESVKDDPRTRGMFGFHAGFTLGDASLKHIAKVKPKEIPIHVHTAEDRCDVEYAQGLGYQGALQRFSSCGLLNENSLAVHGVHLTDSEFELAQDIGLRIAHNPESNCNNRVGFAKLDRMRADRILLGTDGMNSNMLGALRSAFLLYSGMGKGAHNAFELMHAMLFRNPSEYLTNIFGRRIGQIRVGDAADFAIFPYAPPTTVNEANWFSHIVYALSSDAQASWVYANGQPVFENGRILPVDETEALKMARETAARVWQKYLNS
ncbi:hypothetical protein EHM69_03550 [candidate division KSB1 bacterium]|nr:MAG: hypothetical protein EHM69_03550 [candidate division KSB1 bacterium]